MIELDEAGPGGSDRVIFELDVLRNSDERNSNSTIELGNLGDNTLGGLPEITSRGGEVYGGIAERHVVEELTKYHISSADRNAVSTGVSDGGVSIGSTVPLGVRDDVMHSPS